jgi:hydroxyacylglutathione hydrolase
VRLGAHVATVLEVPAHTAGHIAYHFAEDAAVFVGDTLFAMGCGRLFEGTAAQMFANMQRLGALPPRPRSIARTNIPSRTAAMRWSPSRTMRRYRERMEQVDAARAAGGPTVPTTIALELATNPFLRAESVEMLAERRAAKDAFTG